MGAYVDGLLKDLDDARKQINSLQAEKDRVEVENRQLKFGNQLLQGEKEDVVLENWQLKQENQMLRDENSELKLPKPPPPVDDEMEPAESLEERLDHIERRLSDIEEWRRSTYG